MSYLPGVPDMGPAPVAPMAAGAAGSKGMPHGIAGLANKVGKPGRSEQIRTIGVKGAGNTSIGGGNPALHSLGQYGKNASKVLGNLDGAQAPKPTDHPGVREIRGGAGQMRRNAVSGGLAEGRISSRGTPSSFNMTDEE